MDTTTEKKDPTLDEITDLALKLSPLDRVRLIERLLPAIKDDVQTVKPRRSLLGALAHLGTAPSAEEIDEARREAWANFPREDI